MLINEYYYLKTNTYNTSNLYFKVRVLPKVLYREAAFVLVLLAGRKHDRSNILLKTKDCSSGIATSNNCYPVQKTMH